MNLFQRAKALFSKVLKTVRIETPKPIIMEEIALRERLPTKVTKGAFGARKHNPAGTKLAKRFAKHAAGPRGY